MAYRSSEVVGKNNGITQLEDIITHSIIHKYFVSKIFLVYFLNMLSGMEVRKKLFFLSAGSVICTKISKISKT